LWMFSGEILLEELSNKPKSCGTDLRSITAWARVKQNPLIMHHKGWMESEQGTNFFWVPVLACFTTYIPTSCLIGG
jgi:hypothetical protein